MGCAAPARRWRAYLAYLACLSRHHKPEPGRSDDDRPRGPRPGGSAAASGSGA